MRGASMNPPRLMHRSCVAIALRGRVDFLLDDNYHLKEDVTGNHES
jgi:hypothetical protein